METSAEIEDRIFSELRIRDAINLGRTNKRFNQVISNDYFWERRIRIEFLDYFFDKPDQMTWKEYYIRLSEPKYKIDLALVEGRQYPLFIEKIDFSLGSMLSIITFFKDLYGPKTRIFFTDQGLSILNFQQGLYRKIKYVFVVISTSVLLQDRPEDIVTWVLSPEFQVDPEGRITVDYTEDRLQENRTNLDVMILNDPNFQSFLEEVKDQTRDLSRVRTDYYEQQGFIRERPDLIEEDRYIAYYQDE